MNTLCEINNYIDQNIFEWLLGETKRIQPMNPRSRSGRRKTDKDRNTMPYYQADVDDEYFNQLDLDDKLFNNAFMADRHTRSQSLTTPQKSAQERIAQLRNQITKNIQKKAIAQTGGKYVPLDQFTTDNDSPVKDGKIVVSQAVYDRFDKNGCEIGLPANPITFGNTKLPNSTMVINLTSGKNCPSREQCPLHDIPNGRQTALCYADNGYQHEPEIRDLKNGFSIPFMSGREILKLVEAYLESAPCKIRRIRMSEAGDFSSQEQVEFLDKLAGHLKAKYPSLESVACYTRAYLKFGNCSNIIVNSSFPDENVARMQGADRQYLAVGKDIFNSLKYGGIKEWINPKNKKKELYFKCHCNCKLCNFCYQTKEQNGEPEDAMVKVYCEIHK